MREIKFRGLDVLTGEWCYGSLLKANNEGGLAIWRFNEMNIPLVTMIDRDTAGQNTGLKDKNGAEIYEGDILGAFDEKPLYVEYIDKYGAFCFMDKYDPYGLETYTAKEISYDAFEIIGNIHENPDLMEVSS